MTRKQLETYLKQEYNAVTYQMTDSEGVYFNATSQTGMESEYLFSVDHDNNCVDVHWRYVGEEDWAWADCLDFKPERITLDC